MNVPKSPAAEQCFVFTCTFPVVGEVTVMGPVDRKALESLAFRNNVADVRADSPGP